MESQAHYKSIVTASASTLPAGWHGDELVLSALPCALLPSGSDFDTGLQKLSGRTEHAQVELDSG